MGTSHTRASATGLRRIRFFFIKEAGRKTKIRGLYGHIRLLIVMALISGVGFLSGCGLDEEGSLRKELPAVGEMAAPFGLTAFDGKEVSLEAMRGKPVVVNFWASWCGPCREEAPGLEKLYLSFREMGVGFIGVAVHDSVGPAGKFAKEFKWSFPAGVDATGEIAKKYKIYVVPQTFVVDKNGIISFVHNGAITEDVLAKEIKKLL